MKKIMLTAALLGTFAVTSFAQSRTPHINRSQCAQQHRIHNGVRHGELTRAEAHRLQAQQRDIQRTKRWAKADGVVTPRERAVIRHKQRLASRNIYAQKHDRQVRW